MADAGRPLQLHHAPSSLAQGDQEEANRILSQRQQWAKEMRLIFSPKDMIFEDGSLNPEYFKPKQKSVMVRKWTSVERMKLIKGIEKYGIGKWPEIRTEFLPMWEIGEIRIKTQRLMGRQSLVEYIEAIWKGDETIIEYEYARNKKIGLSLNMWKGGILVNDEKGVVKQQLETEPLEPAYSNYLAHYNLKKANEPSDAAPKEVDPVGQRVSVWFTDAHQYFTGLVTSRGDEEGKYMIVWDSDAGSPESEPTEVLLPKESKTLDEKNQERWCFEIELVAHTRRPMKAHFGTAIDLQGNVPLNSPLALEPPKPVPPKKKKRGRPRKKPVDDDDEDYDALLQSQIRLRILEIPSNGPEKWLVSLGPKTVQALIPQIVPQSPLRAPDWPAMSSSRKSDGRGTISLKNASYKGHSDKESSFLKAAAAGKVDKVSQTVKSRKVAVDCTDVTTGVTALMVAAMHGHREVVELLVHNGANVNAVDTSGQSVLHKIVSFGTIECLQPILNHHPALDPVDNQDCTPLVLAVRKKTLDILEKLLKAGADFSRTNEKGNGLLHEACTFVFPAALEPLLRMGMDVNSKNGMSGNTPLHVATLQGSQELVLSLLRNGADPCALNASKMSPSALATAGGQKEIAAIIDAEVAKCGGPPPSISLNGTSANPRASIMLTPAADTNTSALPPPPAFDTSSLPPPPISGNSSLPPPPVSAGLPPPSITDSLLPPAVTRPATRTNSIPPPVAPYPAGLNQDSSSDSDSDSDSSDSDDAPPPSLGAPPLVSHSRGSLAVNNLPAPPPASVSPRRTMSTPPPVVEDAPPPSLSTPAHLPVHREKGNTLRPSSMRDPESEPKDKKEKKEKKARPGPATGSAADRKQKYSTMAAPARANSGPPSLTSNLPPPPGMSMPISLTANLPPPPGGVGVSAMPPPPASSGMTPSASSGNLTAFPAPPPSAAAALPSSLPPPPGVTIISGNTQLPTTQNNASFSSAGSFPAPPPSSFPAPPPGAAPAPQSFGFPAPPPSGGASAMPPPPASAGAAMPPPPASSFSMPPPPPASTSSSALPPPPSSVSSMPPPPAASMPMPPPPTMSMAMPPPPASSVAMPPPPAATSAAKMPPPPTASVTSMPPPPASSNPLGAPPSFGAGALPPPPASSNPLGAPPTAINPLGAPPSFTSALGAPPASANPLGAPPSAVNPLGAPPTFSSALGAPPASVNPLGAPPTAYNPLGAPPSFASALGPPPSSVDPLGAPPSLASFMPPPAPASASSLPPPPSSFGAAFLLPPPGASTGLPPPPGGSFALPPPPGASMGLPPPPSNFGLPPPPGGLPPPPVDDSSDSDDDSSDDSNDSSDSE